MRLRNTALLFCCLGLLWHSNARGNSAGAISLSIDPSIRSQGMAGASAAAWWGGDPNYWANPALLGYHSGFRYEYGKTQLVPDLARDVFFTSTRYTVGAWGVGFAFGGKPGRLGGSDLSYGTSTLVDIDGNVTGIVESYELVETWGVGGNLVELTENIVSLFTERPTWSRYGDVSIGYAKKEVLVDLAAGAVLPGFTGPGTAETYDFGLVGRVTPFNTVNATTPSAGESLGGMRVDLGFSWASLNHDDASINFGISDDEIARDQRFGFGARFSTGFPMGWRDHVDINGHGWIADALTPLVSAAFTYERSSTSIPSAAQSVRIDCSSHNRYGFEVAVANILTLRTGYVDDPDSEVQDWAFGFGLGFRLHDVLGFRYDYANTPQASGLESVGRQGVSVFIDGLALTQTLRQGS